MYILGNLDNGSSVSVSMAQLRSISNSVCAAANNKLYYKTLKTYVHGF